jgi:hypothetical protein
LDFLEAAARDINDESDARRLVGFDGAGFRSTRSLVNEGVTSCFQACCLVGVDFLSCPGMTISLNASDVYGQGKIDSIHVSTRSIVQSPLWMGTYSSKRSFLRWTLNL